jgi:purine-nucleoside phosphorylase
MAPQLSRRAGGQAPAPAAQHPVVLMQGRVHYYEGYSTEQELRPRRVRACRGARGVVRTNAAGGLRAEFHPGDLMLLRDHIASFVPSPLRGPNLSELGPRFPDMTCVYDERLRALLKEAAAGLSLLLPEGVYLQVGGPQFETPAEIEVYRLLGADATGMSTAVEAIAAHHAGMRVAGISCITNLAAGMSGQPLSSEEVEEVGQQAATHFAELLVTAIPALVAELGSEGAGAR